MAENGYPARRMLPGNQGRFNLSAQLFCDAIWEEGLALVILWVASARIRLLPDHWSIQIVPLRGMHQHIAQRLGRTR